VRGPNIYARLLRPAGYTPAAPMRGSFYLLGDAFKFADPRSQSGLCSTAHRREFQARHRHRVMSAAAGAFIDYCAAYVRDVVIAGEGLRHIARAGVSQFDSCARFVAISRAGAAPAAIVNDAACARIHGAASKNASSEHRKFDPRLRALLMAEPPSLDRAEMTDKGSINQRAVLKNRGGLLTSLRQRAIAARHQNRGVKPWPQKPTAVRAFSDAYLTERARTPFADYTARSPRCRRSISASRRPRAAFEKSGAAPVDVGTGDRRQHGAGELRRLHAAAPYRAVFRRAAANAGASGAAARAAPASNAGAGFRYGVRSGRAELALCVGTESMSRNPGRVLYQPRRLPHGPDRVQGFLWEALLDPACGSASGDTAENLARQYQITRPQVDDYAARSSRARSRAGQRLPRRRDHAGDERKLRSRGT